MIVDRAVPTQEALLSDDAYRLSEWCRRRERDDAFRYAEGKAKRDLAHLGYVIGQKELDRMLRRPAEAVRFLAHRGICIRGGAFPTTSVLINYTAADNTTPPTGGTNAINGTGGLKVTSNTGAFGVSDGTGKSTFYVVGSFGPDAESYQTIATEPTGGDSIFAWNRLGGGSGAVGTTNVDGYASVVTAGVTNQADLFIYTNAALTQLGAAIPQTITSGDAHGIESVSSTHTSYYKVGAGAWTALTTRSDATHTGAGAVGWGGESGTFRLDDSGGGTVVVAGGATTHFMSSLGAGK